MLYWSGRALSFGAPELDSERPAFNVGIGTLNPQAKLDIRGTTRTTVLEITSDRNAKRDLEPVSSLEVLEKLAALPITTWAYTNNPSIRHIGPMAQDFHAAFGLGESDRHIATVDADGVALAALQGLYQIVEEREAKIRDLGRRLEILEHKLENRPATP
jgi:hypothetical protein